MLRQLKAVYGKKDASPLGASGETSTGISEVLLDQPAGGDIVTVHDWCNQVGVLQPADASIDDATATQPTTGRCWTLSMLVLLENVQDGS